MQNMLISLNSLPWTKLLKVDIIYQDLRQSFTLNNSICPLCPIVPIITILCVFDSYLIAEFYIYIYFPIAFGIAYPDIFSDFSGFYGIFPTEICSLGNIYT